jgi:glycerophosphoryl diester phosphodiesterase
MAGHDAAGGPSTRAVELIAHRAGNLVASIEAAARVADAIEVDVHLFRGRLEVRHAKVLWPSSVQWERWEVVASPEPPPRLAEILRAVPDGTAVWLDLKGPSMRLPRRVRAEVTSVGPVTVSSRWWYNLRPFRRSGDVRTMRSVGNRAQLAVVSRLRRCGPNDGIVIHERLLTPSVALGLRHRTDHLCAWAVDDERRASELVAMGCSGLIIDDLGLVAALDRVVGSRRRRRTSGPRPPAAGKE